MEPTPAIPPEPVTPDLAATLPVTAPPDEIAPYEPKGYWDLVWGQFRKNGVSFYCLIIIGFLMFLAALAPLVANGKPYIWHENGQSHYPLIESFFAPNPSFSIDHVFNMAMVWTLITPFVFLGAAMILPKLPNRRTRRRRYVNLIMLGMIIAVLPFLSLNNLLAGKLPFRSARLDAMDYHELAPTLKPERGDYAVFPPIRDAIADSREYLRPPDRVHWLGTDKDGRDVLARMLHGSRISLSVGFVAMSISVILGILFGGLAGYYRGWVDILISRFIEIIICFPSFFLILTIVAFIEPKNRSILYIMIVIGLTSWTGIARLVRGEFLKLSEMDFVQSARALGCTGSRLIFRHMLPNAMAPVLVSAAFEVAGAILTESGLSYLGFGAPPPTPSWGELISQGKEHIEEAGWLIFFPGIMIFLTVTVYNLAGDGLRDAMDPKMRK